MKEICSEKFANSTGEKKRERAKQYWANKLLKLLLRIRVQRKIKKRAAEISPNAKTKMETDDE